MSALKFGLPEKSRAPLRLVERSTIVSIYFLRPLLLLSFHLRFRPPNGHFPWDFSTKPFLASVVHLTLLGPLDRGLGGSQSRCGRCGKAKNPLALPEIYPWFLSRPSCSLSLYRLSYPGSMSGTEYKLCSSLARGSHNSDYGKSYFLKLYAPYSDVS
jgi:hypothetical protein